MSYFAEFIPGTGSPCSIRWRMITEIESKSLVLAHLDEIVLRLFVRRKQLPIWNWNFVIFRIINSSEQIQSAMKIYSQFFDSYPFTNLRQFASFSQYSPSGPGPYRSWPSMIFYFILRTLLYLPFARNSIISSVDRVPHQTSSPFHHSGVVWLIYIYCSMYDYDR